MRFFHSIATCCSGEKAAGTAPAATVPLTSKAWRGASTATPPRPGSWGSGSGMRRITEDRNEKRRNHSTVAVAFRPPRGAKPRGARREGEGAAADAETRRDGGSGEVRRAVAPSSTPRLVGGTLDERRRARQVRRYRDA